MERLDLAIDGMSCGNCVKHVRHALEGLQGVDVGAVEIGSATLSYDPAVQTLAGIVAAVDDAGYTAREAGSAA